ncbi:DNA polymerase III subunit delta' [Clostridium sporogenes]|uniref:DNA polymerase III subunit delta' n=1 Tax=Clostridium sporogenes TaxID=1509 RepID=UPI0013D01DDF|nr:DNA polymerase III subunit delta' [Clostridium sporogenes]NFF68857.1 DNA polymerase III subunit delta' [Clostridium sporogenes]NFF99922.1 DNA polymerase III subunit delta' [Clostridium sporogenes]NFG05913.1 DNA polymerase III subunit delta' [Clostridium sporogenes]NFG50066.1 DNA polymerase III subunit delta' [Clostridium sporogenes]NFP85385.1 DNA polymerase III subunit delta' [Clostridium sporogenes]
MNSYTIIGHENIKNKIKNSIVKGKFSHASIIVGEDGIGKSIIAKEIAMIILEKSQRRSYADLIEFKPINKKSIGIDDIRNLIEEINKKPIEGNKKVIIIYKSELITEIAQNAFLKTIEEPPKGVYIILLCENMEHMLDTIKSRCEIFKLNRLKPYDIENFIKYKYKDIKKDNINSAIAFSDGIPGKAERFIEDESLKYIRDMSLGILKDSKDLSNYNYLMKYENFLINYKETWEEILTCILSYLRDSLLLKETGDEELLLNVDKKESIKDISEKYSYINLDKIVSIINDTRDKLNRNINSTLVFDAMLIKMQEV